jgi:hypothetical protein
LWLKNQVNNLRAKDNLNEMKTTSRLILQGQLTAEEEEEVTTETKEIPDIIPGKTPILIFSRTLEMILPPKISREEDEVGIEVEVGEVVTGEEEVATEEAEVATVETVETERTEEREEKVTQTSQRKELSPT